MSTKTKLNSGRGLRLQIPLARKSKGFKNDYLSQSL